MIIKHISKQENGLNIHSLGFGILSFLIILSFVLPTVFTPCKIILLAILVGLLMIRKDKLAYDSETLLITLTFVSIGWIWTLYGLFNNNPGAISVITVNSLYPLLFLSLSYYINFQNILKLRKILTLTTFFIILFQIIFLLSAVQILPFTLFEIIW